MDTVINFLGWYTLGGMICAVITRKKGDSDVDLALRAYQWPWLLYKYLKKEIEKEKEKDVE